MSGNPVSKRRQLGEAIAFLRNELSMTRHTLADKTRSTTKIVERWEEGVVVPTSQEWQRMRQCFPPLMSSGSRYNELYRSAAAEQLALEQTKAEIKTDDGNDMEAAVRLLIEAVPSLRSMSIEVDDDGEISISYKTREVRVIEDSGSLKVKAR